MSDIFLEESSPQPKVPSMGTIRFAAMGYLARREHSQKELHQKLARRFEDLTLIEKVLQQLHADDLQSDERFAESFVAARIRRGQGPVRIGNELKQRGVAIHFIETALDVGMDEWLSQARSVIDKKYGRPPSSPTERAKQSRFLQYRGFTGDQIRNAIKG